MMKKLVVALALLFAVAAEATEWTYEGGVLSDPTGWKFTVSSGTLSSKAAGTATELDFSSLPSGCAITAFGQNVFKGNKTIVSIVLPTGITTLGAAAFSGCSALESVTPFLPETVTSIGSELFNSCAKLRGPLVLPSKFAGKLADSAFNGCSLLDGDLVIPDGVTEVGAWSFMQSGVTSLTFGEQSQCTIIGRKTPSAYGSSFQNCAALTNVVLAQGIETIMENSFYGCSSLVRAVLPQNLKTIGAAAFQGCSALNTLEPFLPATVTSIGKNAFGGASKLRGTLVIPAALVSIGGSAFSNCSLITGDLVFPDTVTTVDTWAFMNVAKITSATFGPDSQCTVFGDATYGAVFQNCTSLTNVVLPHGVKTLVDTFNGCTKLVRVVLPLELETVSRNTFSYCSQLEYVTPFLPPKVKAIPAWFMSCPKLKMNLTVPDTVTSVGSCAFYNSGITGVVFGKKSQCTSFGEMSPYSGSQFFGCTSLTNAVLPRSLTIYKDNTFKGCTGLKEVTFGNCPETRGKSSFAGCTSHKIRLRLPRGSDWEDMLGTPTYSGPTDVYAKWKDVASADQAKWVSVHGGSAQNHAKGFSKTFPGEAMPLWVDFYSTGGLAISIR